MQIEELFQQLQPALAEFAEGGDLQLVCEFTGSNDRTVHGWVTGKSPANGEREIRLWHFLLAAGYDVPGSDIDAFNFYLAELFAYSIITKEEAGEFAGVKKYQTAFRIMRGQPPAHPEMSLQEMQEMCGEQLQLAKATLQQRLRVRSAPALPPLPEASAEEMAEAPAFDVLVPVLSSMVQGLLPLARLAVESWTPEQRSRLRTLVGDDMFELANKMHELTQIMNALNSERARVRYTEGK